MDFSTLVDEVAGQFTSRTGVQVKLSVETETNNNADFDQNRQRTIKENCSVLKCSTAELEDS